MKTAFKLIGKLIHVTVLALGITNLFGIGVLTYQERSLVGAFRRIGNSQV